MSLVSKFSQNLFSRPISLGDIGSILAGASSSSGAHVTQDSAMRCGAVYSCVNVLSQSVAQLPIHLFEKNNNRSSQVNDNSLAQIIREPNAWMTGFDMRQLIMTHLLLRGNSIWFKSMIGNRLLELLPIHPDSVSEIMQDAKYKLMYKIKRPGSSASDIIPASNILHFRGLSLNGYSGMNPVEQAREMIGLSISAEKYGSKLYKNGARLGGILSHPGRLTEQASKRLRESFEENYASVENAHRTAILEEGMKWEKISMTAEDSQFLEARKYQRSEIAGFYRVPPHFIGDLQYATFSNVENQDLGLVKHTLMPWLVSIEQTLQKDLMTQQEKTTYYFKFNVDGLLRGDIQSRTQAYATAIQNSWLNPNEVRELEDRNPYDGGDTYRTQSNMQTAGSG